MEGPGGASMDPRILVVDDDALILRIMHDTLSTLPADVVEADDGEKALAMAKAEQLDLILLDTMMPRMDGFQVAEHLKQDPATADIPLIFVSALGTSSHKVRGLDLGAEDYLSKPIDPEELKARVRSILRRVRRPAPAVAAPPAAPAAAQHVTVGQLHAMPLPTLIRWMELERRDVRLILTRDGEEGRIVFRGGQISQASEGRRRGAAAVYQLLGWKEGTFNILPGVEEVPATQLEVQGTNEELLQEGTRRLEEIPKLRAAFPGPEALLELPAAIRTVVQAELPPDGAQLVTLLDGTRNTDRVLAGSPLDGWMTLRVLQGLQRCGALGWAVDPAAASGMTPRRGVPRVTVEGPVQYQNLRALQQAAAFTLSGKGVFLQTASPFEVGDQVLLRFQLAEASDWITAIGQVIASNADPQKSRQEDLGMMLQFTEVRPDDYESIDRRLVQSITAEIQKSLAQ
jgi:DNA-binding response OmpR family regulator/Tfp pilus assembly protein PilZ